MEPKGGKSEFWDLDWTPERIERFWDWHAENAGSANYFSQNVGEAVLRDVTSHIKLSGTIVDLGAGPGYLVEKLLARNLRTIAVDTSAGSVETLRAKFASQPQFLGAIVSKSQVPIENGIADAVFLIETMEHLSDEVSEALLEEVRRILRIGGYVIVTTPNEERLADSNIVCPNCACVFHRIQHLRSLSAASLGTMMKAAGFIQLVCKPTYFSRFVGIHALLERIRRRMERLKDPHLLYIGARAT